MWILLVGLFSMVVGFIIGQISLYEEIRDLILKNIQWNDNNVYINKNEFENKLKELFKIDDNDGGKEDENE